MSLFAFIFGPSHERETLEDGDKAWTREWDRGSFTEKEVTPDRSDPYIERTYRDGGTYREYGDGSTEKVK